MFETFAYLDAGTGSLFIQAVFGTGLAASFALRRTLRVYVAKVKLILSRSAKA